MTAQVSINPYLTSNAAGSFQVESVGLVQGTFYDDPAARFQLAGGTLASTETLPMWGGVAISELVPGAANTPGAVLGTVVSRALSLVSQASGQMTGFSVFNQAHAMVNSPQSPVPLSGSYGPVNFFRFGSNARIAVPMTTGLVSLQGGLITTNVSWDFVNQMLIPGIAAYNSASVQSAAYTSSTGILALTFAAAPFGASVGSTANGVYISVSGITGGAVNGDWPITGTASSGTVISASLRHGQPELHGAAAFAAVFPGVGSLRPSRNR
jgi:hypothetical protein